MKRKKRKLSLKSVYYLAFLFLVVVPLLVVLAAALLVLNRQFKRQAVENMERAQETIRTELEADIKVMSMRLSHLIYTNDNEIMRYAAGTDTEDVSLKYEYEQKLSKAGNLALEPVKNVVSVTFYMKDGRETYIKSEIHRDQAQIKSTDWYQAALENPNAVYVGSIDTTAVNDLYTGGKKDLLVLIYALSPDVATDRSQRMEMVTFYQTTGAGDTIKKYNQEYLREKNQLGITRILTSEGSVIFDTEDTEDMEGAGRGYTVVQTPLRVNDGTWLIESQIKTSRLMKEFYITAVWILGVAILIFLLAIYYSRYFLASIIKPVEEISSGLRQVEEGNLEMHIAPSGQYEVRSMIHQFNAMVRRLRALIHEYEERVSQAEHPPADYLGAMLKGEMTAFEAAAGSRELFMEDYILMELLVERYPGEMTDSQGARELMEGFERNPRFAARCWSYESSPSRIYIFYRVMEEDYFDRLKRMVEELQGEAKRECGITFAACIGTKRRGPEEFEGARRELEDKLPLHFLHREDAVINLADQTEDWERILELSGKYRQLAEALYIADDKVLTDQRDQLFAILDSEERGEAEYHILAAIVAIGTRFDADNGKFFAVFQQQYEYRDRLQRLENVRGLKLWLTNYFAWIMDYSAAKLNLLDTESIVRAKHYLQSHYEEADLTLTRVAEYVGLNEKYFTNKFTREAGETFSSYLTGLRIQKAKELLKTTTFKVYEIAEMVGYNNTEHFTRMFKKLNGISPAQYRKTM